MARKYEKSEGLEGRRYGRLTIMGKSFPKLNENGYSGYYVECLCDCGNKIVVRLSNLKAGRTKSCGCYRKDCMSSRMLAHPVLPGISRNIEKYIMENEVMLKNLYSYFISSSVNNAPNFKDFCFEVKRIMDAKGIRGGLRANQKNKNGV